MNIVIKSYELKDAEFHCVAVKASIESLNKWFSWASPNYCLCDSIKFIKDQLTKENKEKYSFAIIDSDDNEFLGSCVLTKVKTYNGEQIASMSYWRRQDSDKRCVMWQAAKKVMDKAFNELGIKRIEIDIACCNKASIRVAEKIGAIPLKGTYRFVAEMAKYTKAQGM